jgi:hypothetical protein
MMAKDPTLDKSLIGAAGVHFVVSELSLRGLIALPTIRNTASVDIVAVNKQGTWQANIQVKTSRSKVSLWPISENYPKWCGPNNYYAFVRYLAQEGRLEVFLETSIRVIEQVRVRQVQEAERGLAKRAPCWYLQGEEERLL